MKFILLVISILISIQIKALDFHTAHLPPFSITEGRFDGPFYIVAKKACEMAKITCHFHSSPWKRIMKEVKSGQYNACYVIGRNKDRESWMHFSSPVVQTEYGFFYIKDTHKKPLNIEDLKSYDIVVHEKSNTHKQLLNLQKKHGGFHIVLERDVHTSLRKFARERFPKSTLLYGNKDIYFAIFKKMGVKNVRYAFKDKEIFYHYGFSKKSVTKQTLNKFETALQKLKKNGFLKKELNKYSIGYPNK